ncbi:MAG: hypothetical protein RJB56_895 [Actinomycetota bacterium]
MPNCRRRDSYSLAVAVTDIDDFLANTSEPDRSALLHLREQILRLVPDAVECISYAVPCFKVNGKGVAGFAPYKKHLSYFPFSGQTLKNLREFDGFSQTQGALHFSPDKPLTDQQVQLLIDTRLREIAEGYGAKK